MGRSWQGDAIQQYPHFVHIGTANRPIAVVGIPGGDSRDQCECPEGIFVAAG